MKYCRAMNASLIGTLILSLPALAQKAPLLKLVKTVNLPGYTGDFDHSAIDGANGHILLSAEDHGTLEVFDLNTGDHLRTVKGFDTPHSILVRPGSPTIFVTDGGPSLNKLIDGKTYEKKATVPLVPGGDSIGYDAAANIAYVVTGGEDVKMETSELAAVDPGTGKKLAALPLNDNHVEAMAVEKGGNRIFLNLTQHNSLAVIDRKAMRVQAVWKGFPALQNAMVAIDEQQHRLYMVCRKPGMVVVLNSDTGKVIGSLPAPNRSDDVILDASTHRLYVPGGDGFLSIYDTSNADHLALLEKMQTAPGAKTGLLLAQQKKLMLVASPGDTKAMAKVLFYALQ